jgi:predicted acyl esterase
LLEPGRIYELRLSNLLTANLFAPGHRLRVQISATFAPHFSRNLQTGESEVTSSVSQPASIRIHHDAGHASRLHLPVVER